MFNKDHQDPVKTLVANLYHFDTKNRIIMIIPNSWVKRNNPPHAKVTSCAVFIELYRA